jgi:hypothetical protein
MASKGQAAVDGRGKKALRVQAKRLRNEAKQARKAARAEARAAQRAGRRVGA